MSALADANRIARNMGLAARYTPADRCNPAKAREMWRLYLDYYGACYAEETGRRPSDQVYARIWNGGPTGWKKRDTRGYWGRVRNMITQDAEEEAPAIRPAEPPPVPLVPKPDEPSPWTGDAPADASERPAEAAPDTDAPAAAAADDTPPAAPRGTLAAVALIIAVSAPVVLRSRLTR
jgi:hypothetical protein